MRDRAELHQQTSWDEGLTHALKETLPQTDRKEIRPQLLWLALQPRTLEKPLAQPHHPAVVLQCLRGV